MRKVRYVAKMTVEIEIDEDLEKKMFPNGFNKEEMVEEMNSDTFDELLAGDLKEYEAEGFIIENDKIIAQHKEKFE